MSHLENFSKNALKASSSWNRTLEGEGSEDEEAPERRGFRAGVDLRLSAIDTTDVNRNRGRKGEEQSKKSQATSIISNILKRRYVCMEMHEHVTCKTKSIIGSAQSKPINTQTNSTHQNACQYYYNANVMQCMRF